MAKTEKMKHVDFYSPYRAFLTGAKNRLRTNNVGWEEAARGGFVILRDGRAGTWTGLLQFFPPSN